MNGTRMQVYLYLVKELRPIGGVLKMRPFFGLGSNVPEVTPNKGFEAHAASSVTGGQFSGKDINYPLTP